jgi:hypothetical protein
MPQKMARAAKPNNVTRQFVIRMMHLSVRRTTLLAGLGDQLTSFSAHLGMRSRNISAFCFGVQGMRFTPLAHVGRMARCAVSLRFAGVRLSALAADHTAEAHVSRYRETRRYAIENYRSINACAIVAGEVKS